MTVKYTKQEQVAIQVAKDIATGGTIQKTINDGIAELRKLRKGKPLETLAKGCAVMVRVVETWNGLGLKEQTVKNYATAFRKAYNDNKPFSMNPYRDSAKKGASSTKANEVGVKITIKGEPDEATIAEKLREIFNGWKKKDKHAELAMFLLDGLDEFDGK